MVDKELMMCCDCEPVVDMEYQEGTGLPPSAAIIDAIAEAAGVDPLELPPLYEYIDTEALDDLFEEHVGITDTGAILAFQIDTWNVFVRADGRIRVCDATRTTNSTPVFASATD